MNHGQKPWEINPSLAADRLTIVGGLLVTTCEQALAEHLPDLGDTALILGIRTHVWQMRTIVDASQQFEWLHVRNATDLRFEFAFDQVVFRFWRGDPASPSDRILTAGPMEAQLGFDMGEEPDSLAWRYTFELNTDRTVGCVYVQQFSATGATICCWQIPISDSVGQLPPPQEVAPADYGLIEESQDEIGGQSA